MKQAHRTSDPGKRTKRSRPSRATSVGRGLVPRRREEQVGQDRQDRQRNGKTGFEAYEVTVEVKEVPRWPSISLCMIVKNEEANLRPCIESVGDLVSEIIVVDTGSTDETVRIARELGARVFHFDWVGDFAAARNESIRHATGQWIFWMDADDRLDPRAIAQLKWAAASGAADAFLCMVSSRTPTGERDITEHVRLFRNGLGIRFSSAVHETVFPDLVRLGLRLVITDIEIQHTGYESQEVRRIKAARNLAILESQIEKNPEDHALYFYRGQARGMIGDTDGLAADLRHYLESTQPDIRFNTLRFWAHASLLSLPSTRQDPARHRALLDSALAEFPGHPRFLLERASIQMAEGRPEEALADLRRAHEALKGKVLGLAPSPLQVELRLAECCRELGRRDEAISWAERAHRRSTGDPGAGIALARLYLEAGRLPEAEATLIPLEADTADRWLLMAELRLRQIRPDEAQVALENAARMGLPAERVADVAARIQAARVLAATRTRPGPLGPHSAAQLRGLALLSEGMDMEAAELFAASIQQAPTDPDGYRYLAVALQKLGREAEAREAWRLGLVWQQRAAAVGGGAQ